MIPRIDKAHWIQNHTLHVRFTDGTEGDVDLGRELDGEIFQPLKDVEYFKKFNVHSELHTITWPNGADFAPEFLYDRARVTA